MKKISDWFDLNFEQIISIRRHLHQNPEIGYEEKDTSAYLKKIITELGLKVQCNSEMKYGFYTEIGPFSGKTLAIRCDIDALPIQDIKKCEYASNVENKMHACGHDAHMSIMIGLIKYLKEIESSLKGRIRFIFQPAEECSPGGALSMIAGNAINNISDIIGYHLYPKLNAGKIAIKQGYISSTVSVIDISLSCKGGHTSRPEESVDLVLATSDLVCNINKKINKMADKESPIVFVFGSINGGKTFNVIPSNIKLKGTLRYTNSNLRDLITEKIKEAINEIESFYGAKIIFETSYSSPGIFNNKELTNLIIASGLKEIGNENVILLENPSLGGEDFAFYLEQISGVYFRIGCFDGKATDLHSNYFDIDENSIKTGITILSRTIQDYKYS